MPFLFSLTNNDNKPLKMKIHSNLHKYAIYCHSLCSPTFGDDINIAKNANTRKDSSTNFGHTYSHPQYEEDTNEAETFLSGSFKFQLDQIEVFQKQ